MEIQPTFKLLNKTLLSYYQHHNYDKKEAIQAYSSHKEDIASFYKTMKDYLYQNTHLKRVLNEKNNLINTKKLKRCYSSEQQQRRLTDPLIFSVPKSIPQRNVINIINIEKVNKLNLQVPIYEQIQTKKQGVKECIKLDTKSQIYLDIRKMQGERENGQIINFKRLNVNPKKVEEVNRNGLMGRNREEGALFNSKEEIDKLNKVLLKNNQKFIRPQDDNDGHNEENIQGINYRFASMIENLYNEKIENDKAQALKQINYNLNGDKNKDFMRRRNHSFPHNLNNQNNKKIMMNKYDRCRDRSRLKDPDHDKTIKKGNLKGSQGAESEIFITNNEEDFKAKVKTTDSFISRKRRGSAFFINKKNMDDKTKSKEQFQKSLAKTNTDFRASIRQSMALKKVIFNPKALELQFNMAPKTSFNFNPLKSRSQSTNNKNQIKSRFSSLHRNTRSNSSNQIKLRLFRNYNNGQNHDVKRDNIIMTKNSSERKLINTENNISRFSVEKNKQSMKFRSKIIINQKKLKL